MKRYSKAAGFVLCLVCAFIPALAQETIVRDVTASGGGRSEGPGYLLSHTVGQPAIGPVTGSGYGHEMGFWYMPWFYATDAGEEPLPPALRLYQNYPNPFNPVTTIRFALPKPALVDLRIYDVLGREVMTVIDRKMKAGVHEVPFRAGGMSTGVYFYRLIAAGRVNTRKMILLR